ncbi:glycosyltransferase [Crocinitomicaceae bacterium]|nr:glycosyltransferase [Crocinitomicaceae bacterium]
MTNFPKTGTFIASNKHILFITPGFPENEQDSQCIPALWIYAKALAESGTDVSIITLQYPFVSESYKWNGISVYPMNGANKKVKQLFLMRKAVECAVKIHKEKSVDVVHSFWLHRATDIAMKVSQSLSVPMIATAMGQEMRNPNRRFERWKKVNFPIVSISEFQSDALKREGVIPTSIIPWGIENAIAAEKDVDLICVGSLIPLKNVSYFLELCAQLKSQNTDYKAAIIGDGPEKVELQNSIQSNDLSANVQLVGSLSYEETQKWIARSKVLVHASNFEGFGMTIIEAMANETHVLATPVGIAKSLEIPHLIGDLELDGAMVQLLLKADRPESRIFQISETVDAYQTIYESVSRGKATGS